MADGGDDWLCREHYVIHMWCAKYIPMVYNFVKVTLDSVPFFAVWVVAIMVWFFLELTTHASHCFNIKHATNFLKAKEMQWGILTYKLTRLHPKNLVLQLYYRKVL